MNQALTAMRGALEFAAGELTTDLSQLISQEFRHLRKPDAAELADWTETGIERMERLRDGFAPQTAGDIGRDRGQAECMLVYTNIADAIVACSDFAASKKALARLESVSLSIATALEEAGGNALGVLRELNRIRHELDYRGRRGAEG